MNRVGKWVMQMLNKYSLLEERSIIFCPRYSVYVKFAKFILQCDFRFDLFFSFICSFSFPVIFKF